MNVILNVKIEVILFENDQGFKICRVSLIGEKPKDLKIENDFCIKGVFANVVVGQTYKISGQQVEDTRYGWQINVNELKHFVAQEKKSVVKYLASDLFSKIGKITAEKIVEKLGPKVITLIEENPDIVDTELNFLKSEQKEALKNGILQNVYIEKIFTFFENTITIQQATNIFLQEGIDALTKYRDNPYLLYFNFERIYLQNVDAFVLKNNICDYNAQVRLEAFVLYFCKNLRTHTYASEKDLKKFLNTKKITDFTHLSNVLITLEAQKQVKYFDECVAYYINYQYEKNIAFKLKKLASSFTNNIDISHLIQSNEINENIQYTSKQKEAIINVFCNNISIITGGPGTGKTTIINAICKLFKQLNPDKTLSLIAPTGKAATRISEVCQHKAYTIHSRLGLTPKDKGSKYNSFNQLEDDLIVLDEASMVDIEVFSKLLDAIKPTSNLVIVGDVNQLSSVGPGQVLSDIIDANIFKVTRLDVIKRQSANSNIIKLAHDVLNQKLNKEMFKQKLHDFEYYQINDNQAIDALKAIIDKESKHFNLDDIQIISPRRNSYGTNLKSSVNNLNQQIASKFNPQETFLFSNHNQNFYLNDRIINNENMQDKNIANGDQGFLRFPVFANKKVVKVGIEFDQIVEFGAEELKQIDLAYATTVHKAQGSEYKLVILFLLPQHKTLASKKLIYTAITRAKQKLIVCGNYEYISNAIKNEQQEVRNTKLLDYLGE